MENTNKKDKQIEKAQLSEVSVTEKTSISNGTPQIQQDGNIEFSFELVGVRLRLHNRPSTTIKWRCKSDKGSDFAKRRPCHQSGTLVCTCRLIVDSKGSNRYEQRAECWVGQN